MNVTAALHAVLAADSTLGGLIGTYGGSPAVFTAWPVPPTAPRPYIVSAGPVADQPFDGLVATGREITRDVYCICDATGTAALVEAIAERVRLLLHRQPLTISGAQHVLTTCANVATAPTDPTLIGRVLTFRITARAI